MVESTLPEELDFLNKFVGNRGKQYYCADWLESEFSASIWEGRFDNYSTIKINFDVELDNGGLLTSPNNESLLEVFKCWLCVQTHFDATGGRVLAPAVRYHRVTKTLNLIDYFLLNAKHFELSKQGLMLVTQNDLVGLLKCLASSRDVASSIYRWPEMLEEFLRNQLLTLDAAKIKNTLELYPFLSRELPDKEERLLDLDDDQIVLARVWLWVNGYYKNTTEHRNYRYVPNTQKLANTIYPNTLWGRYKKPVPPEFLVEPIDRYYREYPSAPSRNLSDKRLSEKILAGYKRSLRYLGLLGEIALPVPLSSIMAIEHTNIDNHLNLKSPGRTLTLPLDTVLSNFRNAIEFSLEYGEDILESSLAVFSKAAEANTSCEIYCRQYEISPLLTDKLRALGVRTWCLKQDVSFIEANPKQKNSVRAEKSEYFRRFRANEGLLQLIRVLFGAIQFCTGLLVARRQGELIDLVAGKCLDKTETRLVFYNRKSGEMGFREKIARPIHPTLVRLIKLLERFQLSLIKLGILEQHAQLFSYPDNNGMQLVKVFSGSYNDSLNIFCDYFETPLNKDGERFYFRQHQLRRFFAMLFFWGNSFGGMDTLRWFLGHTDIQQLYRYITESTPGKVLRSVKANYAGELTKAGAEGTEPLADLIAEHFGTQNFSILDANELDEYIEELIATAKVAIEPEFLETPEGQSYRILIKVTSADATS